MKYLLVIALCTLVPAGLAAQRGGAGADPFLGAWRGTVGPEGGERTPLVMSVVMRDGRYVGTVNLGGANETSARTISVTANRVVIEAGADSRLGSVVLSADLMLDGNKLTGGGTLAVGPLPMPVTIEMQRQGRADVLQPPWSSARTTSPGAGSTSTSAASFRRSARARGRASRRSRRAVQRP